MTNAKKKEQIDQESPEQQQSVPKDTNVKKAINELQEPQWSVISFESCAGSGFTYDEAVEKMAELAKKEIYGLCVVTDDSAGRIND